METSKYYKYTGAYNSIWNSLELFHLFYLFDWKFVDQMNFSFLQGKMCASEKSGARQRFCIPKRARCQSDADPGLAKMQKGFYEKLPKISRKKHVLETLF